MRALVQNRRLQRRLDAGDDLIVQWAIFLAGLVPVAVATVRGGTWGVQPSIGLLFMLFALPGLTAHYRSRRRAARNPSENKRKAGRP